jgi:thiamine-phosphate pyrophosphorylase
MIPFIPGGPLYGILDAGYCEADRMPAMLAAMLAGGVSVVQLRAKGWSGEEVEEMAGRLHPVSRAAGVPLVINDFPEAARRIGVEGVHVGQDDMSVAEARALAGPGVIVGKSTHSVAQARAAWAEGADYLGFGPLFATPTKPDYRPIGTDDIRTVNGESPVPVFCIGGIKEENLPAVLAAGARRVVIVSGILQSPDPAAYARRCLGILGQQGRGQPGTGEAAG